MTLKSALRMLAPRTIRPHRILSGPLRGKTIATSFHDYPAAIMGRTEQRLLAWFTNSVKPGETWLDVGAHYGYTAIALAELVGSDGHVYAFEPSLTTAGYLNWTCRLNRLGQVVVVPIGLGEPGGLRLTQVSMTRGMASHRGTCQRSEPIYLVGFDCIWAAFGRPWVHGVKIDVQGMELAVLQGMAQTIKEQQPKLVIEFHPGVDREPILSLLAGAGYRLPAQPIEPFPAHGQATYLDDRSYVFVPPSEDSKASTARDNGY